MRIDAHQHFWTYSPSEYGWIDERMEVIRRDFTPDDLKPHLESHRFDGSVVVQARQSLDETDYLLRLAEDNVFVLGVVGWVDLCSESVERELDRFRAHPGFVGVRHIAQDEPDDRFLVREDFMRGVALLRERDLSYDVLVYPRQLLAAEELVNRFPDQRFVLDHIAKPYIARQELEPWASSIRSLARNENLFCKVSGMVTEADWRAWEPAHFMPYLDVVFEAFGPRRILVGSDWPVCTLAATYDQVMELVERYIDGFSDDEKKAVLGDNAVEFYKLEVPTHAR